MTVPMKRAAPIVVGVDGSTSAHDAVGLAAAEALRRHRTLRVVHAQLLLPFDGLEDTERLRDGMRGDGWQRLHDAADAARDAAPGVELDLALEIGDPATVLIRESASAYEVMVGSRGAGGFAELLAGSTALAVSTYGHCPVTIVRGTVPLRGPIVVGVDGTAASEPAIELAFDRAALDGADLIAVHVWHPRISAIGLGEADRLELTSEHHQLLAERLAGWQEKYPDVHVERVLAEGHVAKRLADYSDTARLLVVGPLGRGGFAGLLLGSTSHALLHHAPCPVLVARTDDRAATTTA
ncbi:universal stress protein [Umezawaea sp. Da 62-37]|uniref:universal stress protein n=1 Tax=Umezawaea sp. Da 62-37 TaxID=3075927 RepID=UPI0028F6F6F4|nr:universal stress protein [Umezawaea sp. Da 62-37]WNV87467.1 universal stress protein [Umezawaea sp. Da 62-37]